MWILFSFFTAFCETAKDLIGKKASIKVNEYVMAFALQLFAALVLFPILLISGIPKIQPLFWILFIYGAVFSLPAWSILYMKAIKLSPLSLSIPMLSFVPIFTTIFTIIFERKAPTVFGWTGIILITVGLYLSRLNKEKITQNIFLPILSIREEPGSLCMLGVSFIWGIGGTVSKFSTTTSSPLFSSFMSCFGATFTLYIIARFKTKVNLYILKENFFGLFALGGLNGFSEFFMRTALLTGYVPFVSSLKRSSMLFTAISGKFFFHEKLGKIQSFGIFLMFAGVLFLVIFK